MKYGKEPIKDRHGVIIGWQPASSGIDQSQEEALNDIATLLCAFWHHPAPSTRAQIECFIARHLDGVTVQQLRACNLEAPSADLAALLQEKIAEMRKVATESYLPGYSGSVFSSAVLRWADELEALLLGRRGAEKEQP